MSATVTYKGNTLTTVNNETKVLNTSGTWLEDNITITDVASGVTPAGTISIDDEGTYDVTNYASAEVDIDYSSKVREITFVINRQDTSNARIFSIYGTFGSTLDFSQGIKSIISSFTIAAGESTASYTIHCPKQRPIIVVGAVQAVGNYDVTIDSSYGECVDVPHILGSTNTAFTKAIYLKTAAPDAFIITITLGSQAAYPESVVTSSLSVTTNGTYTASSGTAYNEVTVNVSSGSALVVDTPDSHGGTIREITAQNEVVLQAQKTITPTSSQQTVLPDTGYDGFASVIVEAASGGRNDLVYPKDVDFIDYDGRLLYSYTADEFLALTEMPANPTNTGLVAQGWNWSLSDAKNYVGKWGALVIGQSYITDDGRTRAYVHLDYMLAKHNPTFRLYISNNNIAGSINIYWGDSTSNLNEAFTTTQKYRTFDKIYSSPGDYIIEIEVLSGSFSLGYYGSNYRFLGDNSTNSDRPQPSATLTKVEIGSGITTFGGQPFAGCTNLQSITIPTTVTGFINPALSGGNFCDSGKLTGVVFPSGFVGSNTTGTFPGLQGLKYISAPKSLTKLKTSATMPNLRKMTLYELEPNSSGESTISLGYTRGSLTHLILPGTYTTLVSTTQGSMIEKFTIPETVTKINTEALMYSYWLVEIHCLPTTPPAMANVRALNGLASNAVIYVPYSQDHSILEAYQTATNWSTFASYMQEEPQS